MVVIAFEYNANSLSSYAIPLSSRPFFVSHAPKLNFSPVMVSMKYASNSDHLLDKELEFKPSFDEYLKAMESSKSLKKGYERNHVTKIYKKDDEGSSTGNGNARGKANKGKERNQISDDSSVIIKSQGEITSGGIRSNLNGVHGGNVVERGVAYDLYSSKMSEQDDVARRERDHNRKGKTLGADNFVDRKKARDRNGRSNGNIKRFHNLEVERAAFKNLEDPKNVITKAHFSHKEMEDRIQKLAKQLNGVDINLPEWMFSKMIRSAKLKFNDYSIRRLITILGNLGNWQRVIQVIEWLQMRERFQSHKPRYFNSLLYSYYDYRPNGK